MTVDETPVDGVEPEEPEAGWRPSLELLQLMIPGRSLGISYTDQDQGEPHGGEPS